MIFPYADFDLSGVKTYPLKSRASKSHGEHSGQRVDERGDRAPGRDGPREVLDVRFARARFQRIGRHVRKIERFVRELLHRISIASP